MPVRLAKVMKLGSLEQAKVLVTTQAGGLLIIEPRENLMARYNVQAANGIVEAKPNTAFEIIVANFGLSPVVLPKGMVIGYATRSPVAVHALNDCASKSFIASVLAIPEEALCQVEQARRDVSSNNGGAETSDGTAEKIDAEPDWRKKV